MCSAAQRIGVRRTYDEARDDEGQDHELEDPHEEFSRVRDEEDGVLAQRQRPQQASWRTTTDINRDKHIVGLH